MRRLSFVIVSVVLLAGCSSGGGSDDASGPGTNGSDGATRSPAVTDSPSAPGATSTTPTGPPCSSVWQEGKTLPADYAGCLDGDVPGEADVIDCEDGSRLITYANEFFARSGDKIIKPADAPLQDTEEYSTAFSACTGE